MLLLRFSKHWMRLLSKLADSGVSTIAERVLAGEELSKREACALMEEGDLYLLGFLADELRRRQVGDLVSFVVNRQINYTNACVAGCKFCAFYRPPRSGEAYTLSVEEVVEKASQAAREGATELHIVGAHNPELPFEYYESMLRELRRRFPELHLKAFTATEIAFFSRNFGMSIREVLLRLKEAGLRSMPGGGAEILDEELRRQLCPGKASAREWLRVMRTAHELGIKSNATMLFGHVESLRHRVEHMLKLRELQKETRGFMSFIPLVYHPENTPLKRSMPELMRTSAVDVLRTIAVARILLGESFRNIRAYWVMLGKKLAQVALHYGANDLDGTVVEERVAHAAGAETEQFATREELVALIREAGRVPVQRSTDYRIIQRWD